MGTKRNREVEGTYLTEDGTGAALHAVHPESSETQKDSKQADRECSIHAGSENGIRQLLRSCNRQCGQIFAGALRDTEEDVDRIIPKVTLVRRLVEERFGALWGPRLVKLAVGALVCFRDRRCDVGLREHVQMLYVIEGGTHLRAHNGQVFTYTDGSWNTYEGLISEGAMARCSTYLIQLEGLFRAVAARSEIKREEEKLIDSIAWVLSTHSGPGGSSPERALQYFEELSIEFGDSKGAGTTWIERTARGVSNLKTELLRELVDRKSAIFAYYSEWCSVSLTQKAGIAFTDTCVVFTENESAALQVVRKSPSNDIYVYVGYPLLDPVELVFGAARNFLVYDFLGKRPCNEVPTRSAYASVAGGECR